MEDMRQMLRSSLGRSLNAMPELDRLQAAWPVACGPAMARHGTLAGLDAGILRIVVDSSEWLEQMRVMRPVLERELAWIANVQLAAIHFEGPSAGSKERRSGPI